MKVNPCRYCVLAYEHNGKHFPSLEDKCGECENIKKHRAYLLGRRKFEEGEPITCLDELLKQEWVMWHHSTKHIEVIKHAQLSTILRGLEIGTFRKAIRKESEKFDYGRAE